jgi:Flp pilus assembly pilin Flp
LRGRDDEGVVAQRAEKEKAVEHLVRRLWREDEGVLTFEWILLITVLVIGVVGGLSAARDGLLTELGDVAEGMISLDQSFSILDPWDVRLPDCEVDSASGSSYRDGAGLTQDRIAARREQGAIQQCSNTVEEPLPQP